MSKKRKNAGAGYGYDFSGAFSKKSDAVKKEKSRKGSFIKGVYIRGEHRYAVMTPRTNPRKRKPKAPKMTNPTELLVMGANPHEHDQEITVPAGSTITIRMNPTNPDRYTSAQARAGGHARPLGWTPLQKRVAKMVRTASGSEGARMGRAYKRHKATSRNRGAEKVFHELYGRDNPICGARVGGGEVCTRQPGHRGPHLPQGATMRPKSRLRKGWQPKRNPSAAAIHERFTGKEGKWVTIHDEPHMPAGDYAQLGELLALYFKPVSGGQVQQISFAKSDRPIVVADETARQIYFVGGNQTLSGMHGTLGQCRRIDYKQRKEHVPDPESDEWRHSFGEESGIRPTLVYDSSMKRLWLSGGDYRIEEAGIIN